MIIETIFYDMIDYEIGSKECSISSCCAPSSPIAVAFTSSQPGRLFSHGPVLTMRRGPRHQCDGAAISVSFERKLGFDAPPEELGGVDA